MNFVILLLLIPPMVEDLKEREIRNLYWIAIIIAKIIQLIIERDKDALISSLLGTGVSILILSISYLINREGIGAGDIKLLISLGFASGFKLFLSDLFYISLCSLLFSIFLLATKKASKNTSLPFAPFIFAGTGVATLIEELL